MRQEGVDGCGRCGFDKGNCGRSGEKVGKGGEGFTLGVLRLTPESLVALQGFKEVCHSSCSVGGGRCGSKTRRLARVHSTAYTTHTRKV